MYLRQRLKALLSSSRGSTRELVITVMWAVRGKWELTKYLPRKYMTGENLSKSVLLSENNRVIIYYIKPLWGTTTQFSNYKKIVTLIIIFWLKSYIRHVVDLCESRLGECWCCNKLHVWWSKPIMSLNRDYYYSSEKSYKLTDPL